MSLESDKLQLAILGGAAATADTYFLRHTVTGDESEDYKLRPYQPPNMPAGRYYVSYRCGGIDVGGKNGVRVHIELGDTKVSKQGSARERPVSLTALAHYEKEIMATELEEAHLLAGKRMVMAKDQAETLALMRFYRHELAKQQHGNLLVQNGNAELFRTLQDLVKGSLEQSKTAAPSGWGEIAGLVREVVPSLLGAMRPHPDPEALAEIRRLQDEVNKLQRQKRRAGKRKGIGDAKKPT